MLILSVAGMCFLKHTEISRIVVGGSLSIPTVHTTLLRRRCCDVDSKSQQRRVPSGSIQVTMSVFIASIIEAFHLSDANDYREYIFYSDPPFQNGSCPSSQLLVGEDDLKWVTMLRNILLKQFHEELQSVKKSNFKKAELFLYKSRDQSGFFHLKTS